MLRGNIFSLKGYVSDPEKELFETIFTGDNCKVERIVSSGHITPKENWYDQEKDEWIVLLQGNASLEFSDKKILKMESGDFVFIPARKRHRVTYTSISPPCIWLAIHGNIRLPNTEK